MFFIVVRITTIRDVPYNFCDIISYCHYNTKFLKVNKQTNDYLALFTEVYYSVDKSRKLCYDYKKYDGSKLWNFLPPF